MATGQRRDFMFRRQFQSYQQTPQHNRLFNGNNYINNPQRVKTLINKRTGARVMVQSKFQISASRDQKIAQNLQQLRENAAKKRRAQESYYSSNFKGRSPLVRMQNGPAPFVKQDNNQGRGPVRQRLGANSYVYDKVQQGRVMRRNFAGQIKTVSSQGKVVYLQQMRPRARPNPAKLTVCVENDKNEFAGGKHHVSAGLNPVLQQEIKMIQQKPRQIVTSGFLPSTGLAEGKLPIVTTGTTLHERFSMI